MALGFRGFSPSMIGWDIAVGLNMAVERLVGANLLTLWQPKREIAREEEPGTRYSPPGRALMTHLLPSAAPPPGFALFPMVAAHYGVISDVIHWESVPTWSALWTQL